jgi:hypothetical protein
VTNSVPMDVIIGVTPTRTSTAAAATTGAGVHLANTTVPAGPIGRCGINREKATPWMPKAPRAPCLLATRSDSQSPAPARLR